MESGPDRCRRTGVTVNDKPIETPPGDRERLPHDPAPGMVGAADRASRAWGLIVLAVGLWFFADVTLGLNMPALAWRELWPIVLIVIGLAIVLRGLARRR
jgi:hypothetical protein